MSIVMTRLEIAVRLVPSIFSSLLDHPKALPLKTEDGVAIESVRLAFEMADLILQWNKEAGQ